VSPPPGRRDGRVELFLAAALVTAVAWAGFHLGPPMPVQVGMVRINETVPADYQASAFPAFTVFVLALVRDVLRDSARSTWLPRAILIGLTGLIAVVRLTGALPLSGHAVFLAAVIAYEVIPPLSPEGKLAAVLAALGSLIVGYYKIGVWGDWIWLTLSVTAGAVIGTGSRIWALARVDEAARVAE
jgi:hypothetical protein